jgi:hypothetical protein
MRQLLIGFFLTIMLVPAWGLSNTADPRIGTQNNGYVFGLLRGIVAINAHTGVVDPDWNPDLSTSISAAIVWTLATDGTYIYAGGQFSRSKGTIEVSNLAAFNPAGNGDDGTPVADWRPACDGVVQSFLVKNSILYAGGNFGTIGSNFQSLQNLAALDLAGGGRTGLALTNWSPAVDGAVMALATDGNRLYVGGNFSNAGGAQRECLAALTLADGNAAATADPAWNPRLSSSGFVSALCALDDALIVGGFFESISTGPLVPGTVTPVQRLAAIEFANGTNIGVPNPNWTPLINDPGTVFSLSLRGERLIAGGTFTEVAGQSRAGLAELELPGAGAPAVTAWAPVVGQPAITHVGFNAGPVYSAARFGSNGLLAGGNFYQVNGIGQPTLAAFAGDPTAVGIPWLRFE